MCGPISDVCSAELDARKLTLDTRLTTCRATRYASGSRRRLWSARAQFAGTCPVSPNSVLWRQRVPQNSVPVRPPFAACQVPSGLCEASQGTDQSLGCGRFGRLQEMMVEASL
jgi:hypothetical protein